MTAKMESTKAKIPTPMILLLNASSCLIFGCMLAIMNVESSNFLGFPSSSLLRLLGVVLFFNGIHLIYISRQNRISDFWLCYFSFGDFFWVALTMGLVFAGQVGTTQGVITVVTINIMISTFGILQMSRLSSNSITVEYAADSPLGSEELWKRISSFADVPKYVSLVSNTSLIEGKGCEIGAVRSCKFKNGLSHSERVIEVENGISFSVEVFDHGLPIKKAVSKLRIEVINGDVFLRMIYTVTPYAGQIGKFLGELIFKPYLLVQVRKIAGQFAGRQN